MFSSLKFLVKSKPPRVAIFVDDFLVIKLNCSPSTRNGILTEIFISSWQIILELFQNLLSSYNVLVREWQSILLLKLKLRKRKENFAKINVLNKDFVMKSLTFCWNRLVLHLRKLQNGTSKKK